MDVKVISCFPAHPRRRRYETEPPTDRKAFRLCVDDADRDRLLDNSKWPDSVVISELYHINPDNRRKATTATEEENANEPSDHHTGQDKDHKNSSGDEIANVNFLRRYGTYVLQNTKKENLLRLTN